MQSSGYYGKVLTGFDTAALIAAMKTVPMPLPKSPDF